MMFLSLDIWSGFSPTRLATTQLNTSVFWVPLWWLFYLPVNRGYYMAAQRYKISLRVLKNISRVSAANEWNIFFQHEKRNFVKQSKNGKFTSN